MTVDQEFLQQMRDYFAIAATRYSDIMTSNQDVMNEIVKLAAAHTQLHTTVTTAIADMGTGGDAARAAFVEALKAAAAQISKTETELTAAIAAATSPPAGPVSPA